MLNRIFLVATLLMLGACVSTQPISPKTRIIDAPSLNVVATAELGETVVEKGRLRTFDGMLLSNPLQWGDGFLLKKYTVSPGRLRARQQDAKFIYFYSEDMTSYDALLGTHPYAGGGLCRSIDGSGPVRGFIAAGACNMNWNANPEVAEIQIQDVDSPGFRQELIYNGRIGDSLKFLYREFSGDMMRPPFSQEVQYDLKDSTTIGFRGVRIEIVEATNTQLQYRVLSSFPDPGA
ncbi:hypothetical protein [Brevundimonas intermedia]|uniref:hypothetical protein n=1 Tax=Brevundimonas intermedia TaxID=74315 RepID=UPI00320B5884